MSGMVPSAHPSKKSLAPLASAMPRTAEENDPIVPACTMSLSEPCDSQNIFVLSTTRIIIAPIVEALWETYEQRRAERAA